MLKALLKKQFLELNQNYFKDRKTGKNRSKAGTIAFIGLFVLVFIGLGAAFFSVGMVIGNPLIGAGYGWLYFSLMGLIALVLGIFGSVFNTYAGLYHAKDNELLLSMPIPPSKILLTRLVGVYAMGLLYEALVMVPTLVVWWVAAPSVSAGTVVLQILLIFLLGFIILALTCALGWVVALISGKLKNKSFITVLITLAFIAVYYVVYFRISIYMNNILSNADQLAETFRSKVYPVYAFGMAGTGHFLSWLAIAVIAFVLCALCYVIMSRTFLKIVTANKGEKKVEYKEQPVKTSSVRSALLRRELLHFKSSPTYMLNCGLGIVLLPLLAIVAIVKANDLRGLIEGMSLAEPMVTQFVPLAAAAVIGLMSAMNTMTAPSVSLEGKSLWIAQSLPVEPWGVLQAKLIMHIYLSAAPTIIAAVVLCIVLKLDYSCAIYTVVIALLFVQFSAVLGLMLNLKKPNLTWTSETIAVKQSIPVLLVLFGLWAVAIVMGVGYYPLRNLVEADMYMIGWIVILALANRFLMKWLRTKGSEIFANL